MKVLGRPPLRTATATVVAALAVIGLTAVVSPARQAAAEDNFVTVTPGGTIEDDTRHGGDLTVHADVGTTQSAHVDVLVNNTSAVSTQVIGQTSYSWVVKV